MQTLDIILYVISILGVLGFGLVFWSYLQQRKARRAFLQADKYQSQEPSIDEDNFDEFAEKEEEYTPMFSEEKDDIFVHEPDVDETENLALEKPPEEIIEEIVAHKNLDVPLHGLDVFDVLTTEVKNSVDPGIPSPKTLSESNWIVLYVMAPRHAPFVGYELHQSLLASGLRFGEMNIFHYYDTFNPRKILFSVASAVEPGIFDLPNMGSFICEGLSLFMSTNVKPSAKAVFEKMLETAIELADSLQAKIYDHQHQPLSDETITAYRQQLTPEKAEVE